MVYDINKTVIVLAPLEQSLSSELGQQKEIFKGDKNEESGKRASHRTVVKM
jgi:hypothetical protein